MMNLSLNANDITTASSLGEPIIDSKYSHVCDVLFKKNDEGEEGLTASLKGFFVQKQIWFKSQNHYFKGRFDFPVVV